MEAEGCFDRSEETGRNIAFQVMMRDSHGTIETDHWGVVTNAGTFDEDGCPIEGGMYDPDIFGLCDMGKAWEKALGTYSPEKIVGKLGVMELALPVLDPYCPKEIDPAKWVHITAITLTKLIFQILYILRMDLFRRCGSSEVTDIFHRQVKIYIQSNVLHIC